jgi:RNA polymerase sigma-70 factor (ECF subfamily)
MTGVPAARTAHSDPGRARWRNPNGAMLSDRASSAALDIDALRARDPEALEWMVRQYSARLYRFIFRIVQQPDDAQGLLQEIFLQALRSLPTFQGQSKLSTWLYSIASNVTFAHLRKAQRNRVLSEAEIERLQPRFTQDGQHVEGYPSWNPETSLERQERVRIVHRALDRLPEKYREVVVVRDLEERSTKEAAEILGISEANVRVRLHRARNALRTLLEPHFVARTGAVAGT